MNQKTLEIFELCERLAELLGDKEAIADLKLLYEHHPEMFKDKEEVKKVIERVLGKPEIIVNATHSNRDEEIYKVATRLDDKKMGGVVIKNQDGTNEIFHANKKKIKEFDRLKKQIEAGGRVAHFLHPDLKSAWAGSNEHSSASKGTIPQLFQESQTEALVNQMLQKQESINVMPRAKTFEKDFEKDLEESFSLKNHKEDKDYKDNTQNLRRKR